MGCMTAYHEIESRATLWVNICVPGSALRLPDPTPHCPVTQSGPWASEAVGE